MNLVANWRRVLKHAWSIRLIILAGVLSGAEVALSLPDIEARLDWPHGIFAALSAITTAAAFIARLTAQGSVHDDE